MGFGFESSLISIMFPAAMMIGSLSFEFLTQFFQQTMKYTIGAFYVIIFFIYLSFMFLGPEKEFIPVYMTLVGLIGLLLAPGHTRTGSADSSNLTNRNPRMNYLVIILYKAVNQLLMIFFFILMGWLMEQSNKNII